MTSPTATIKALTIDGEFATATVACTCPGISDFETEVTLRRVSWPNGCVGGRSVSYTTWGTDPTMWAGVELLTARDQLDGLMERYFDGHGYTAPIEYRDLLAEVEGAVSKAALAQEAA